MGERRVDEVMNHEVFSVGADERASEVLSMILTLGITAAPVVDEGGRVLGLVGLRDLARAGRSDPVARHMVDSPTVRPDLPVSEAGRIMGERSYHHLVVVDADAKVCGFLSSLDVIRGLVELPASHPPAFAHVEADSTLRWSPTTPLSPEAIAREGFDGPGMLILATTYAPDEIVWAEAAADVRARLRELHGGGSELPLAGRARLGETELGFRVARLPGLGADGETGSVMDVLLGSHS